MQNHKLLSAITFIVFYCTSFAQENFIDLGPLSDFKAQISKKSSNVSFDILSSTPTIISLQTNFINANTSTWIGDALNAKNEVGSFTFSVSNESVDGFIIFMEEKKAYNFELDQNQNVLLKEVDINTVVCISDESNEELNHEETIDYSYEVSQDVTTLESYPGAKGCIYLDFDGETISGTSWKSGSTFTCASSGLSDSEILEVWESAREDFLPFNLNITTSLAVYNSYTERYRQRCVITSSNTFGAYGIAYAYSFDDSNPCFVMVKNRPARRVAATVSHEIGHTLGLNHDKFVRTDGSVDTYYNGHGNWGAIMGSTYSHPLGQWNIGEYKSAQNGYRSSDAALFVINVEGNLVQDDVATIAGPKNDVGYRPDDHGDNNFDATQMVIQFDGTVASADNEGIVGKSTDKDMFSFHTSGGSVDLLFSPLSDWRANLDIGLTLYDENMQKIDDYDNTGPLETDPNGEAYLSCRIQENLSAGTYFVEVYGVGANDPYIDGYSNYGSLGYYNISGYVPNDAITGITTPGSNDHPFTIFNPVDDVISFNFTNNTQNLEVDLLNSLGELIIRGKRIESGSTINVMNLAAGIYFLRYSQSGTVNTMKIVKN